MLHPGWHRTADMPGADDVAAIEDFLRRYIDEHHEFLSWLDAHIESLERGRLVLTVPYAAKLTNVRPHLVEDGHVPEINGGVAATLIDTAGGFVMYPELGRPVAGGVATINLNVNYLRRATADLTATAEVIRAGRTVGVSEVTVTSETPDGDERPVATGQVAYRLFRES